MTKEELRKAIHDNWNDVSYELAMNSEDGKFNMSDVYKAYYAGVIKVFKELGIFEEGDEYVEVYNEINNA